MMVLPCAAKARSVSFTKRSEMESSDEVASSKISTSGCLYRARAMAMRCLSPPENVVPCSLTIVSSPLGRASTKSFKPNCVMMSSTRRISGCRSPRQMFESSVPENNSTFCGTMPMKRRRLSLLIIAMSYWPMLIRPACMG